MSPPSDSDQIAFLGKIQRLLEEGQFTATYKFALLIALVDIAIERGCDDCNAMRVSVRAIGEKFAAPVRQSLLRSTSRRDISYRRTTALPYSPVGLINRTSSMIANGAICASGA